MNYNPFSLEGKTILVTGASSGIGKEIAIECSKLGASVIITGRNSERLNETFLLLKGEKHSQIPLDLTDSESIKRLVEAIPILDGLVLAAGIVEMLPVLFASKEKFDKIYQTNLFSPVDLLRLIIRKKKFKSGLSIVVIDSVAGTYDISFANSVYGSSKAALSSFMKYAALELASKGIRVNTISPGLILTPMHTDGVVEEEQLNKAVEKIPLKRWGRPEEIAFAAIYLLSNASSYLTGSDIRIDGGGSI